MFCLSGKEFGGGIGLVIFLLMGCCLSCCLLVELWVFGLLGVCDGFWICGVVFVILGVFIEILILFSIDLGIIMFVVLGIESIFICMEVIIISLLNVLVIL